MLDEGGPLLAPPLLHDLCVDLITRVPPPLHVCRSAAAFRDTQASVHSDPGHHAAVYEILLAAPRLPDALVGSIPVVAQPVEDPFQVRPCIVADRDPAPVREFH